MTANELVALGTAAALVLKAIAVLVATLRSDAPGQAPEPPEHLDTPSAGVSAGRPRRAAKV